MNPNGPESLLVHFRQQPMLHHQSKEFILLVAPQEGFQFDVSQLSDWLFSTRS